MRRSDRPMTAVVTGMIATYPVGGVAWDYGQYALGLERLGFDVYYLEDTGWLTYDPRCREYGADPSFGVAFLGAALADLSPSLGRRWHFRAMDGRSFGIEAARFREIVARADVFLNVSGGTLLRDEYMRCPRKVLIDTDPGWNHFRNYPRADANPAWGGGNGYRAHDFFFTYAERIGREDCVLPSLGLNWQPTRPPVVLDAWSPKPPGAMWTTVLTWNNYREAVEYAGVRYGTKEVEFERVMQLPSRVSSRLEIAAGGIDDGGESPDAAVWHPSRPALESLGWLVVDAQRVSSTADAYRHYVEQSRGEFSVAKNVYVATRSGWFSCRSTCYLAAGRPAVVQDTGFSDVIPAGEGVVAFSTLDEAVEALQRIEADYERHCAAARSVAADHFSTDRVLGDLLRRIGLRFDVAGRTGSSAR
jgi:hypothetical protein